MASNRAKDTGPEIAFRRALCAAGLKGYRKHLRIAGCTPDIIYTRQRVAVFVHGCFWHRCPTCHKEAQLKGNAEFWAAKMQQNASRDASQQRKLKELGYIVVVVWECQLKGYISVAVDRVKQALMSPNEEMDQSRAQP